MRKIFLLAILAIVMVSCNTPRVMYAESVSFRPCGDIEMTENNQISPDYETIGWIEAYIQAGHTKEGTPSRKDKDFEEYFYNHNYDLRIGSFADGQRLINDYIVLKLSPDYMVQNLKCNRVYNDLFMTGEVVKKRQ